jgi:hypothetical protein
VRWSPIKRQCISALLWAKITRGDYLASPVYLALRNGQREEDIHAMNTVRCLMFDLKRERGPLSPGAHAVDLMQALDPYRARLELAIDNAGATVGDRYRG